MQQFAGYKKQPSSAVKLLNMRQGDQETLREYARRFHRVVVEVPSASTELLIGAFHNGLRNGGLFHSLVKKYSTTLDDLLVRVDKYAKVEEAQDSRKGDRKPLERGTAELKGHRVPVHERLGEVPKVIRPFPSIIPLKVNKLRALEICDQNNFLKRPSRSSQGPKKPVSDQFCDFHKEYGHITLECTHLSRELEQLMEANPRTRYMLVDDSAQTEQQEDWRGERIHHGREEARVDRK